MKRILIVNVNWRGDVLFSTPFIRAVRKNYPDSFIASLVVPRCAPILERNPHLNEVIIFDEQARHRSLWGKLALIKLLRSRRFDTAFLLHRSLTRTLLCYLAGIPVRVGYTTKKRAAFLTERLPPPQGELHKVEYFLAIARHMGMEAEERDYEFMPGAEDQDYASRLLKENGLHEGSFLAVLNPGGNWPLKRWPKENFAQLADRLLSQYQAKVIITGAGSDRRLAQDIAALMKQPPLILCGRTSLGQLAALMAKAAVVIANDSGPLHLAVSQKTKVIGLFGPTNPQITGPSGRGSYIVIHKDVGCVTPCYRLDCKDNRCMQAISVDDVLQAVDRITVAAKGLFPTQ